MSFQINDNYSTTFRDEYTTSGSRLRISTQNQVFENRNTYTTSPILWETATNVNGTVTHLPNESGVSLSIPTASGDSIVRQTYEYFTYSPSKEIVGSLAVLLPTGKTNLTSRVGMFDASNGFFFEYVGTTLSVVRRTKASGSVVNNSVAQSSWNVDKLDGTGASGKTLDLTKIQLFFVQYVWYGTGSIRMGVYIDGRDIICHQFDIANTISAPSVSSGNLPLRFSVTNTGTTSGTSVMKTYGTSVIVEGLLTLQRGSLFSATGTVTAASGARTHVLSVRPKTLFNSITNRIKFELESIDVLVTGTNPVFWEIAYGQALTAPSYTSVNTTYSGFEYISAGTLSGSPTNVGPSGYAASGNQVKIPSSSLAVNSIPVSLNAAGANRDMGTITVLVTGLGGTSACRCTLNWREVG